jgi:hypothetical protein
MSPVTWLPFARRFAESDGVVERFDNLDELLFDGTLGVSDGLWLWRQYTTWSSETQPELRIVKYRKPRSRSTNEVSIKVDDID